MTFISFEVFQTLVAETAEALAEDPGDNMPCCCNTPQAEKEWYGPCTLKRIFVKVPKTINQP